MPHPPGNFEVTRRSRESHGAAEGDAAPGRALLIETKLTPPRLRPGTVERDRVMRTLDAGVDAALTLVAAPPGFGKTTAVRAWCARRGTALAWVTLDGRDNDPDVLWTY